MSSGAAAMEAMRVERMLAAPSSRGSEPGAPAKAHLSSITMRINVRLTRMSAGSVPYATFPAIAGDRGLSARVKKQNRRAFRRQ